MRRLLSLFFATAVTFGNVGDTLRLGEESSPDDLPYDATVECCVRNQLGLGVPIEVAPRPPEPHDASPFLVEDGGEGCCPCAVLEVFTEIEIMSADHVAAGGDAYYYDDEGDLDGGGEGFEVVRLREK